MIDPRTVSYVNIVDTYAKSGEHLKSVCTSPNGDIIWDEGPNPNKSVGPFIDINRWKDFWLPAGQL